jgi:cell division septation protein DedD
MVVGRSQAGTPDPELAEAAEQAEEEPRGLAEDLTFYESVGQENPQGLDVPPEPSRRVPAPTERDDPQSGATLIFLQVAALSNTDQANRLLGQLLDDGFSAFLVRPEPSDAAPLHRVRVGPFATEEAASLARRALEDQGFNPIVPR